VTLLPALNNPSIAIPTSIDSPVHFVTAVFSSIRLGKPFSSSEKLQHAHSNLVRLAAITKAFERLKGEIMAIHNGELDPENNPLKNAPHTAAAVTGDWDRPYSRELAAFPTKNLGPHKFWPSVGRIDDVYGDRNLICSCPAIENYED
jgi:glycine dehydrogenase